jgi:hypothetical protein
MIDIIGHIVGMFTGGAAGGLLRLLPEVLKLFQSKADRAFELEMRKLDWEMAKSGREHEVRMVDRQAEAAESGKQLDAYIEALRSTTQKTGFKLADTMSAMVRPVVMYYFLGMYALYKNCLFFTIWAVADWQQALSVAWTKEDTTQLAGLINFYFVGSVINKRPSA